MKRYVETSVMIVKVNKSLIRINMNCKKEEIERFLQMLGKYEVAGYRKELRICQ